MTDGAELLAAVRGGAERVGLYVGVGTLVLLVLAGIVALAGGF